MSDKERQSNLSLISAFLALAVLRIRDGICLSSNLRSVEGEDFVFGETGYAGFKKSFRHPGVSDNELKSSLISFELKGLW